MIDAERDWLLSEEETDEFKNYAIWLALNYFISLLLYLDWILSVYLLRINWGQKSLSLLLLTLDYLPCNYPWAKYS